MVEPPPIGVDLPGVFQNSADPLFAVNANRRVVFFNSACERLTGVEAKQALGLECRFHGPVETGVLTSLAGSLCPPIEAFEGKFATTHAVFTQPDGQRLWRGIHFVPCTARDGSIAIVLGRVGEPEAAPPVEAAPREALLRLRQRLHQRYGFDHIVAVCPAMQRVLDQVRLAANSQVPVLFVGEEGAGKETLARVTHHQGPNRQKAFVALDCVSLPRAALERQIQESSSAGAIYLRTFHALPLDLQERVYHQLEAAGPRWLAGAHADSLSAGDSGVLFEPLYYKLSTIRIELPPVRERAADLPLLIQQVLERCNASGEKQITGMQPEALELVKAYRWPGNLTELQAVLSQAHDHARGKEVALDDFPARLRGAVQLSAVPTAPPASPLPLDPLLETAERRILELALRQAHGSKTRAAARLNIPRARLHRRMQLLGIEDKGDDEAEAARR